MKAAVYCAGLILSGILLSGCFSAVDPKAELPGASTETTVSADGGPLVLAHYMPWYKAPTVLSNENNLSAYGGHWTGWGAINPTQTKPNGQAKIYAHQYPLTGPYNSTDVNALEYQAALMKLAGIDGVIFDWYGNKAVNDYGEIHAATQVFVAVLKKAGLKFAVCYEDQTIKHMIDGGHIAASAALDTGKDVFKWMQQNWFRDSAYVKYEGRPVVLVFGPQYFTTQAQWDELFSEADTKPYFVDLDNRYSWSDASYNWPPMGRSVGGVLSISALQNYLSSFYNGRQKNKPYRVATAFPAFDDVYEDTGGSSNGDLAYNNGDTFGLTFQAAVDFNPQLIQIATWNDYGEGTIIEPTVERGYRELEYLQEKQHEWNPAFPYTKEDLRLPLEFFKLRYADPNTAQKAGITSAYSALFLGDALSFRARAADVGVSADMDDLRPQLRN